MSSGWGQWMFPPSLAIDGKLDTICATNTGEGQWLSVKAPAGVWLSKIKVFNRRDAWNYHFGSIEVWYSTKEFGDTTSSEATLCETLAFDETTEPEPYTAWCAGSEGRGYSPTPATGAFVTLKQVATDDAMAAISLAEVEV